MTSVALPVPGNPRPEPPISLQDLPAAAHDALRQHGAGHVNLEQMARRGLA